MAQEETIISHSKYLDNVYTAMGDYVKSVYVESVQVLRDSIVNSYSKFAKTLGYWKSGDGGGSTYWWDASCTLNDDGGSVLKPANIVNVLTPGRWRLIINESVNVKQFGAKGDGIADDTTSIQNCLNYAFPIPGARSYSFALCSVFIPRGYYKITRALIVGITLENLEALTNLPQYIYGPRIYGEGYVTTKLLWCGDAYDKVGTTAERTTVLTMFHCQHPSVESLVIESKSTNFRCGIHFRCGPSSATDAINYQHTKDVTVVGGTWVYDGFYWRPGGGIAAGGHLDWTGWNSPFPNGQYSYGTYNTSFYIGSGTGFIFIGTNGENQSLWNCGSINAVPSSAQYKKCMVYGYNLRGLYVDGYECATINGQNQAPGTHNQGFLYVEGTSTDCPYDLKNMRLEHTWQIAKIVYPFGAANGGTIPRNSTHASINIENVQTSAETDHDPGSAPCYVVDVGQPTNVYMKHVHWGLVDTKIRVADPGTDNLSPSIVTLDGCSFKNSEALTNPAALLEVVAGPENSSTYPTSCLITRGCTVMTNGRTQNINVSLANTTSYNVTIIIDMNGTPISSTYTSSENATITEIVNALVSAINNSSASTYLIASNASNTLRITSVNGVYCVKLLTDTPNVVTVPSLAGEANQAHLPVWNAGYIADGTWYRNAATETGVSFTNPIKISQTGVSIGLAGTEIKKHLSAKGVWSSGNINASSVGVFDVTVPGSCAGNTINVGITSPLSKATISGCYLSGSVVRVVVNNLDNSPANVNGSTVTVDCWQH